MHFRPTYLSAFITLSADLEDKLSQCWYISTLWHLLTYMWWQLGWLHHRWWALATRRSTGTGRPSPREGWEEVWGRRCCLQGFAHRPAHRQSGPVLLGLLGPESGLLQQLVQKLLRLLQLWPQRRPACPARRCQGWCRGSPATESCSSPCWSWYSSH